MGLSGRYCCQAPAEAASSSPRAQRHDRAGVRPCTQLPVCNCTLSTGSLAVAAHVLQAECAPPAVVSARGTVPVPDLCFAQHPHTLLAAQVWSRAATLAAAAAAGPRTRFWPGLAHLLKASPCSLGVLVAAEQPRGLVWGEVGTASRSSIARAEASQPADPVTSRQGGEPPRCIPTTPRRAGTMSQTHGLQTSAATAAATERGTSEIRGCRADSWTPPPAGLSAAGSRTARQAPSRGLQGLSTAGPVVLLTGQLTRSKTLR